jgi:hypothetical protein|nr:MAG TPA: hypothetical protein [Caudoviricetes sp.]
MKEIKRVQLIAFILAITAIILELLLLYSTCVIKHQKKGISHQKMVIKEYRSYSHSSIDNYVAAKPHPSAVVYEEDVVTDKGVIKAGTVVIIASPEQVRADNGTYIVKADENFGR